MTLGQVFSAVGTLAEPSSVTENIVARALTGGTLFDTVNQSFTQTLAETAFPRVVLQPLCSCRATKKLGLWSQFGKLEGA